MTVVEGAPRVDHVAIELPDVDERLAALLATGAFKLLREGKRMTSGTRIFMIGDGTGFKLELIESAEVSGPTFAHVALRVADVEQAHDALIDQGWTHSRGPSEIPAARAHSSLVCDGGFDLQVISYAPGSADMVTWTS
ncbi:MAG TPA: VOC family protein [Chloroflexota bacterium]|nr:VOC family protein [Chloroflexota bacterium]